MAFNFQGSAKVAVIMVLFTICFTYFTSLKEYQAQKIIITTSEEKVTEILAPAVTICALNPSLAVTEYPMALEKYCANETNIRKCIDNATFNFSSTIVNAIKGYPPDDSSLMDPSLWIPEVTLPAAGKC